MSSKFKGIFEARQREAESPPSEADVPPSPAPAPEARETVQAPVKKPKPKPPAKVSAEGKRRGRPRGKRSDGEHVQVTAYIREDTHHSVKMALLAEKRGQEFSELVEELLTKWLKSRT